MPTDEPVRPVGGCGHCNHRKSARVGGEDRSPVGDGVQLPPEADLEVQEFWNGFDNQVPVGKCICVGGEGQPLKGPVGLIGGQLAAFHGASNAEASRLDGFSSCVQ